MSVLLMQLAEDVMDFEEIDDDRADHFWELTQMTAAELRHVGVLQRTWHAARPRKRSARR